MNVLKRCFVVLVLSLLPLWAWAEPLDINAATADELAATIDGVGKAKAAAIIKDREANGSFKSVDDLARVKGIGKATIEKNKTKLTVKGEAVAPVSAKAPAETKH